jgi:undecaprenyl-diphosphatase
VLSVGLFVLVAYWSVIAGDPGPTPGDQTAWDVAHDLQAGWLTDVAKGITALGSGWVTFPLAAIAAVILGVRRNWMEFWVLALGFTPTAALVPEIKSWTDRPRPPDPLVSVGGSAFPSGHAAHATLYTWLAVTFALRVVPGITRRSLVIAGGIALTGLIGLTRVYLRVHWLSDVSAGWALGASCLSAVAAVVLVIAHIRDNPRRVGSPELDPGASTGARD